ncbi:MAG: hypothetical protein F4004_04025 [Acidimicrobiia bacterium]|nr:hypothetical protein [Acidimicrobiia bacterium]MYC43966.1 hypothetical protein [Acidimicrobiia bacterium]
MDSESLSHDRVAYEEFRRWVDQRYELLSVTRQRSAVFATLAFLVSAATISRLDGIDLDQLMAKSALGLVVGGLVLTLGGVIAVTRSLPVFPNVLPELITRERYPTIDNYYRASVDHFEREKLLGEVRRYCKREYVVLAGVCVALVGSALLWWAAPVAVPVPSG